MKNKLLVLLIAPIILSAYISAQDVPLNLQCKLMLKIISMDRNFGRFGDPIKIGVSSDNFLQEIKAVKGSLKIKGIEFVGEKISSDLECRVSSGTPGSFSVLKITSWLFTISRTSCTG